MKHKTVTLEERVAIEGRKKYDFFISFHRNAFKPKIQTGAEVFVYRLAASKAKPLADKIQQSLTAVRFRDRGVKEASFYVLKNTRAPALLLEIGFIDNLTDNELFDAKFEAIVDGLVSAITSIPNTKIIKKCSTCGQSLNA